MMDTIYEREREREREKFPNKILCMKKKGVRNTKNSIDIFNY